MGWESLDAADARCDEVSRSYKGEKEKKVEAAAQGDTLYETVVTGFLLQT